MDADFPRRLLSLDIFRGVTIAAMIIVNNLTSWSDTTRFLRLSHAEWHGCTLADLIFPFFIFIVGVTSVFSLEKRLKWEGGRPQIYRHIFSRTAVIFLLGLITGSGLIVGWLFQAVCPPVETERSIWAIFLSLHLPAASISFPWPTCGFRGSATHCPGLPGGIVVPDLLRLARPGALAAGVLLLSYWGLDDPGSRLRTRTG